MISLSPSLLWTLATVLIYAASQALYRRRPAWWAHPLILSFAALMLLLAATGTPYNTYRDGTWPLIWLLGPSVVAFAVPIHDQRRMILQNWRVLLIAVATGSTISVVLSWELAQALMLSPALRASLLPRSISAPFAMIVASQLGGTPGLAATFTAITGVLGATIAAPLAKILGLRSRFARGAMLGMGAHGIGTARAFGWSVEEGTIAATTMTLAGLANVVAATAWRLVK